MIPRGARRLKSVCCRHETVMPLKYASMQLTKK